MSTFNRAIKRALFGAVFTMVLGGCALVYDYDDYVGKKSTCGSGVVMGDGFGPAQWIKSFTSTSSTTSTDSAQSVAVSCAGDIYFAAEFEGVVTIGNQLLTTIDTYALAMAKLDGSGMPAWAIKLGERTPGKPDIDKGQQFIAKLAIDNLARPIVGGTFDGKMDFGIMPLRQSEGYPDVFLQKRSTTDGTFDSGDSYGQIDSQIGYSIAANTSGGTVMTGFFKNMLGLNGRCAPLTATGEYNIFVAKFDNTGVCEWSKNFGTGILNFGSGITFGTNNRIAVVGEYSGMLNFGKDAGGNEITLTSNTGGAGTDHFLLHLDSKGTPVFATTFMSAPGLGIFVATDQNNDIFVVENFVATIGPTDADAIRVRKFSPQGYVMWQQKFTSTGSIVATSIDADTAGHVLITGSLAGMAQLGSVPITGDAEGDVFLLSLNGLSGGTPVAATTLYGPGKQTGTAIRHDPTGGVVVIGSFNQSISDGDKSVDAVLGTDIFVAKFAP